MKTSYLSIVWIGLISSSFCSCVSVKHTSHTQEVSNTGIIQAPLIAELEADVNKKVSSTYRAYKSSENEVKQGALFQAMRENGCDVIVHPVFETKLYPKVIEVNVSGICGKYKTLRKPTLSDVELLQGVEEAAPLFDRSRVAAPQADGQLDKSIVTMNLQLNSDWQLYRKKRRSGLALLSTGVVSLAYGFPSMVSNWIVSDNANYNNETSGTLAVVGGFLTVYGIIGISVGSIKIKRAKQMKPQVSGNSISLISRPVNGHHTVGLALNF